MAGTSVRFDDQKVANKFRNQFQVGFVRGIQFNTGILRMGERGKLRLNEGDKHVMRRLSDETPEFYQHMERSDEESQAVEDRYETSNRTLETINLATSFKITMRMARNYDDLDPTVQEMLDLRTQKYGRNLDRMCYNALLKDENVFGESANVTYEASGGTIATTATSDVPTASSFRTIVGDMESRGVEAWTKPLVGTDQVGTSPINRSYIAIADIKVAQYIEENASSFNYTPVIQYAKQDAVPFDSNELQGFHEAGFLDLGLTGIRLFYSHLAPFWPSAGSGSPAADVFPILLMGLDGGRSPFKVLSEGGGFRVKDVRQALPMLMNNFEMFQDEGGGLADRTRTIWRQYTFKGDIGAGITDHDLIHRYVVGLTGEEDTGVNPYDADAHVDRVAVKKHSL